MVIERCGKNWESEEICYHSDSREHHQLSYVTCMKTLNNNKKKKKHCQIVDFTVPADYRLKLKETKKRSKYVELARELKRIWKLRKINIIPIIRNNTKEFGKKIRRNRNQGED